MEEKGALGYFLLPHQIYMSWLWKETIFSFVVQLGLDFSWGHRQQTFLNVDSLLGLFSDRLPGGGFTFILRRYIHEIIQILG